MRNKIIVGLMCVVVVVLAVFCVRAYQEKRAEKMVEKNIAAAEQRTKAEIQAANYNKKNAQLETYNMRSQALCEYIRDNIAALRSAKAPALPVACELGNNDGNLCPTATTVAIIGKCTTATF